MQAKMWQKDEKLRQLKEIVQVCSSKCNVASFLPLFFPSVPCVFITFQRWSQGQENLRHSSDSFNGVSLFDS